MAPLKNILLLTSLMLTDFLLAGLAICRNFPISYSQEGNSFFAKPLIFYGLVKVIKSLKNYRLETIELSNVSRGFQR
jgi:hypothetical protein